MVLSVAVLGIAVLGIAVLDFGVLGFALAARSEGVDSFADTVGDSIPSDD
jgi:hypothetical protein